MSLFCSERLWLTLYRDFGALPAPSRFANLHYYKDGQFISPEPILYYPERRTGKVGYFGHFGPSINGPRSPMPRVELGKIVLASLKISLTTGWDILAGFWSLMVLGY
ncbi:hypothetical protein [Campylobacter californiensis]|uniref:hypothetical protein n=1 Tax=Campylobacter californiensis TaxID=1032243 RepID=UPI001D14CB17|nr:hypothetical protein [Campylobacter sp. RM12916]